MRKRDDGRFISTDPPKFQPFLCALQEAGHDSKDHTWYHSLPALFPVVAPQVLWEVYLEGVETLWSGVQCDEDAQEEMVTHTHTHHILRSGFNSSTSLFGFQPMFTKHPHFVTL